MIKYLYLWFWMCRGKHIAAIQLIDALFQAVVFYPPQLSLSPKYVIFLLCQGCFLLCRQKKSSAACCSHTVWRHLGLQCLRVGCPSYPVSDHHLGLDVKGCDLLLVWLVGSTWRKVGGCIWNVLLKLSCHAHPEIVCNSDEAVTSIFKQWSSLLLSTPLIKIYLEICLRDSQM